MRYTTLMFKDFQKFIMRGNLIDMAIGFTVGASFSTVAKSLVDDILMPPIGFILGRADFSNFYWLIKEGTETNAPYATLAEAKTAGAITLSWGNFLTNVLSLLIVAFAMFLIIRAINKFDEGLLTGLGIKKQKKNTPSSKKCPFCLSTIPHAATRCSGCTSKLPTN